MQVKIVFTRIEDEEDETLIYLLMDVMIKEIDALLFRTPDYVLRGKYKLALTFYGLSRDEARKIHELASKEIVDEGVVKRVSIGNAKLEEDPGPYMFIQPEYREGAKEDLEDKHGYGINIGEVIASIMHSTAKTFYEDYKREDATAPLTTTAYMMGIIMGVFEPTGETDEEMRDWIDDKIAQEPMYKERRRRVRRRLKKRIRRYSDMNNFDYPIFR